MGRSMGEPAHDLQLSSTQYHESLQEQRRLGVALALALASAPTRDSAAATVGSDRRGDGHRGNPYHG